MYNRIVEINRGCLVRDLYNMPAMQETWVQFLGQEVPLEKEVATHSSILAWRIPWTEEPGRLQSMGSQKVGHSLALSFFLCSIARESVTISCVLLGIQKMGRDVGKLYSEKSGRRQVHSGWRSLTWRSWRWATWKWDTLCD